VADLEVRSLMLKDKDGGLCARLDLLVEGSPYLSLLDKNNLPRARLWLADGPPYLSLSDKNGNPRASLSLDRLGSPSLSLYDKDRKARAVLDVRADGSAGLRLFDAKGNVLWQAPR